MCIPERVASASSAGQADAEEARQTFVPDELVLAGTLSPLTTYHIASSGFPWPAARPSDDDTGDVEEIIGLGVPAGSASPLPVSEGWEDAPQTSNDGQPGGHAKKELGSELIPDPLVRALAE